MESKFETLSLSLFDRCRGMWMVRINGNLVGNKVPKNEGKAIIKFLQENEMELKNILTKGD